MKYDIFISYRRVGGQNIARSIQLALRNYGYNVFFDYTSLQDGEFNKQIFTAIEESPIFILVLSDKALDRCSNEDDWVRLEIIHAIQHNRKIIPINIDNKFKELPQDIPQAIKDFVGRNQMSELSTTQLFDTSIELIYKNRIINVVKPTRLPVAHQSTTIKIRTDIDCTIYIDDVKFIETESNAIAKIILHKGVYIIRLVSHLVDEFFYEQIYKVEDIESEHLLDINVRDKELLSISDEKLERYCNDDNRWGYKYKETIVIEPKYDDVWRFNNGLAMIMQNGKYGYLNKAGAVICEIKYDDAKNLIYEGIAAIKIGDKWGFINNNGVEIIQAKYDQVDLFREGLACVSISDKYGFIDKFGNEVIPIEYTYAESFNCGFALVKLDARSEYGFINKSNREVISLNYDTVSSFNEGLACVSTNDKYGFININGNVIIPLKYHDASSFSSGLAKVKIDEKWGFINRENEIIIPIKYDSALSFAGNLAMIELDGNIGVISKNGNEYWSLDTNSN